MRAFMPGRKPPPEPTHRTTMRLSASAMNAALYKANRLGISRTRYVEDLIRKDLGLKAFASKAQRHSSFG
jgi:hypothetical protein